MCRCVRTTDAEARCGIVKFAVGQVDGQTKMTQEIGAEDRVADIGNHKNPTECTTETKVELHEVLTIRTDSAVVGSVKRTSGGRTKNTRRNRGQGKNTYSGARVYQERHIVALIPDVQKATDRCGGWASRRGRSYGLA